MGYVFTPEEYDRMFQQIKNNEISMSVWTNYCTAYLGVIMEQHRDVFERLKDR